MTTTHRTALVTGASRGLGRALAAALARSGWHLIINARDAGALARAAAGIEAEAGAPAGTADTARVTAVPGDVTDPAHRADLARAVAGAGGLDLLVNNAGTLGTTPLPTLAEQPLADLAAAFDANVIAPLALVQMALPALRERDGAVLNITSDAAGEYYPTWGGYSATKAALDQLSGVLAAEEPRVRVWWADPGEMRTDMLRAAGEDADAAPPPEQAADRLLRLVADRLPSGRYRVADLAGSGR
ncbi:SDR family NAD(P)-dependent oxidoreductase [Spirillospora sp. NPDC127200]